ncbi:32914_t:CDS:2, partial [Racocetra persica]
MLSEQPKRSLGWILLTEPKPNWIKRKIENEEFEIKLILPEVSRIKIYEELVKEIKALQIKALHSINKMLNNIGIS